MSVKIKAAPDALKHVYISREKYKERINSENEVEDKRKADIWRS